MPAIYGQKKERKMKKAVTCLLLLVSAGISHAAVMNFDGQNTGSNHYYMPTTDGDHNWTDAGNDMSMHVWTNSWGNSWAGFTYSDVNDTTTSGSGNQYAVFGDGLDYSDSGVYAIGYVDSYHGFNPRITFASPSEVTRLLVNNTTYAALDMQNGSAFSKEFTTNDWFKLTIEGFDAGGSSLGTVDHLLADYTGYADGDDKNQYMDTDWTEVNLSGLGSNVSALEFTLTSSDTGTWGMNTPAYFAVDQVETVPEPASALLLLGGFSAVFWLRRHGRI
jgi:hypothetical protein